MIESYVSQRGEGTGLDVTKQLLSGKLHCSVCNKLIKSVIFKDNKLLPEPNVNMWEDVILSVRCAFFAKKVVHLSKACYHYNQENAGSYTAAVNYSDRIIANLQKVVSVLERFFEEQKALEIVNEELVLLKLNVKRAFLLHTRGLKRRELQRFYPDTTKYILRQDTVRLYYRIALWAANHCMMPLAVFILTLVNFTKKRWFL